MPAIVTAIFAAISYFSVHTFKWFMLASSFAFTVSFLLIFIGVVIAFLVMIYNYLSNFMFNLKSAFQMGDCLASVLYYLGVTDFLMLNFPVFYALIVGFLSFQLVRLLMWVYHKIIFYIAAI
ncbi:MAG: hypothetical protein LBU73_02155 [Helicobacteraceae bacterium]|jgi:hypothetical protein|nr:hypothetical protein [Helicobacteraceae bacterium]